MSERAEQLRTRLARAFENFSPQGAQNVLDEVFGSMPIEVALSDVIVPYMQTLELVSIRTSAAIARIQFATSVIESRLLAMAGGWDAGGEPTLVLACPAAERHSFAALACGLVLQDHGWRIIYFGIDASIERAVGSAEGNDADVLMLVVREPGALADARDALAELGSHRRVMLAGAGASEETAARLHAALLPLHPVLAATELDRQLGRAAR